MKVVATCLLAVKVAVLGFTAIAGAAQTDEDYEATIAALETQVAERSTPFPEPGTVAEDLTAEERGYLMTVAETLQVFEDAEASMAFFLEDEPGFTDPTLYKLEMSLAILGFAFSRESKVEEAPSQRLADFNQLWNIAIDALYESVQAFIPDGEPEPRELQRLFRDAAAAYQPPSVVLAPALEEIERVGLRDTLAELIDPPPAPGTFTLNGTVELIDPDESWNLPVCQGSGGYSDLAGGANVVIRDGSDAIIGVGELNSGATQSRSVCQFEFTIRDLLETGFYTISISGRDGPTYSFNDLELANWVIALSIGDR